MPDSVKVLSFDVFDTLLMRILPSDRVAQLAAEYLCQWFNLEVSSKLTVSDIINSRYEYKRQMDKAYFFTEAEWTLSQWLNEFAKKQSIDPVMLNSIGRKAELTAETKSLRIARDAVESLSFAKNHGLQVIATSDMWLDQDWLKELLEGFGLLFDHVFTSGSLGVSKRRGTIFKQIESRLELRANAFIHIGDNLKADFFRPRMSDWKSIWMPHPGNTLQIRSLPLEKKYRRHQKLWKDIVQALKFPSAKKEADTYFKFAYDHLAPLLIIFSIVQWRRFLKQKIDITFYIARDAKVMLDVYNTIAHLLPGSPPRHYIRLSRRAVAIAHPDDLLQNVIHLAGKSGKKKIYEWLSNFTISSRLRHEILSHAKVSETDNFTELVRVSLRDACRKILPAIIEEQNDQKRLIHDYLLQQAGTVSLQRVGIVDSGWACTTQDSLQNVLNDSEIISGMYLGVSNQGHQPDGRNIKYGLLRDDFRKCRHHNPLESTAGVIRMWDTVFREASGTVLKLYRQPDNSVKPLLDDEKIFGDVEYMAADSIRQGILEGTLARIKGVSLIIELSKQFTDADFEIAATTISREISTHPQSDIAKAVIKLGFDEGGAGGSKGSMSGIKGIQNGIAWYPGILASLGLRWMAPIMEFAAIALLKQKRK